MTTNPKNLICCLVAVALMALLVREAPAQCCGATPAFQPVAYQAAYAPAYQPVAYQAAYAPATTGWYPGYWLGRLNRRIWGVDRPAYTASYAPTYTAAYAPNYTAAYAPAYTTSYAPSYSGSYSPAVSYAAPAYGAPDSGCTTCAMPVSTVTQAVLRPVCDPCTSCATTAVSQANYTVPSADCACEVGQPAPYVGPSTQSPTPATFGDPHKPSLRTDADVLEQREAQRQQSEEDAAREAESRENSLLDPPKDYEGTEDEAEAASDSQTDAGAPYLQAPGLWDVKDRAAQQSNAPVWMAVHQKPVVARDISATKTSAGSATITREQAERDAIGWTRVSN